MHQRDLGRDIGKIQGFFDRSVSAADHRDRLTAAGRLTAIAYTYDASECTLLDRLLDEGRVAGEAAADAEPADLKARLAEGDGNAKVCDGKPRPVRLVATESTAAVRDRRSSCPFWG